MLEDVVILSGLDCVDHDWMVEIDDDEGDGRNMAFVS